MSKILVSGASGFVGKKLVAELSSKGHDIFKLSRNISDKKTILWDIDQERLNSADLENFDSIVHLAGESILGLWTKKKKEEIYQSRILGTKLLVDRILKLSSPPKTFICASAVGIYGQEVFNPTAEDGPLGNDFLASVCKDWEAACEPLIQAGTRVVNLRLGVVIDQSGGMLKQMQLPFKLGLGAWLGNGKQKMAWVSLEDVISGIEFCIQQEDILGAVNIVAPELISNREFCKLLAKKLSRPCLFGIPKMILKLLLGNEFSQMLLGNQKINPSKLHEHQYSFKHPNFNSYLQSFK